MSLADVMDRIAEVLSAIPGLRTYGFPADSISPPVAYVDYPTSINVHETYSSGMKSLEIPVVMCVGRTNTKVTRDQFSNYITSGTSSSVIEILESADWAGIADDVFVSSTEFQTMKIAGQDFAVLIFNLEVSQPNI